MGAPVFTSHSPHRPVPTRTGKGVPVWTERYTPDPKRMPGEGAYMRAGLGIPHSHRAIETPTGKGVSIRTERYA